MSYGHLIGEVVRRVSGRTLKQFVAEEIAEALSADFQISCHKADFGHTADIVPLDGDQTGILPMDQWGELMLKTFTGPIVTADVANSDAWRAADIGAVNGHGNARSLVRLLSSISLGGTVDGIQLLRPATVEQVFNTFCDGPDVVLAEQSVRWGLGFGLPQTQTVPFVPNGKRCSWGGWGGSWATMNPDEDATFAYVMNKMGGGLLGSERTSTYMNIFYEALR